MTTHLLVVVILISAGTGALVNEVMSWFWYWLSKRDNRKLRDAQLEEAAMHFDRLPENQVNDPGDVSADAADE